MFFFTGKCESCLWKSDSTGCKYWNETFLEEFVNLVFVWFFLAFFIDRWITYKLLENTLKCKLGILSQLLLQKISIPQASHVRFSIWTPPPPPCGNCNPLPLAISLNLALGGFGYILDRTAPWDKILTRVLIFRNRCLLMSLFSIW